MTITNPSLILEFVASSVIPTTTVTSADIVRQSIEIDLQMMSDLKSSSDKAKVTITKKSAAVSRILSFDGDIKAVLKDGETILFTGFLSNKYKWTVTNHGEQALSLTIEDNTRLFETIYSERDQLVNKEFYVPAKVGHPVASGFLVDICNACGITLSSSVPEVATKIIRNIPADTSCVDIMDKVCFELGYCYKFDNAGKLYLWKIAKGDEAVTAVLDKTNLYAVDENGIIVNKALRQYNRAIVKYTEISERTGTLVYQDISGQDDNHPYCCIEVPPGTAYPSGLTIAGRSDDELRAVCEATDLDEGKTIIGIGDNIITDFSCTDSSITCDIRKHSAKALSVLIKNTSAVPVFILKLRAKADITYEEGDSKIYAGSISDKKYYETELDYVHDNTAASGLGNLICQFYKHSNLSYQFYSKEKLEIGEVIKLVEDVHTGIEAKLMINARVDLSSSDIYHYTAYSFTPFNLTEPTTTSSSIGAPAVIPPAKVIIQYAVDSSPDTPPGTTLVLGPGADTVFGSTEDSSFGTISDKWQSSVPYPVAEGMYVWMRTSSDGEKTWAYSRVTGEKGERGKDGDTKIYANWITEASLPYYTIKFVDSDGKTSLNIADQRVISGGVATCPDNPAKTGYNFLYWSLEGKQYSFGAPVYTDMTLKAVWTEGHDAYFNINDGVIYGLTQLGSAKIMESGQIIIPDGVVGIADGLDPNGSTNFKSMLSLVAKGDGGYTHIDNILSDVTYIELPASLEYAGNYAFAGFENLKSMMVRKNPTGTKSVATLDSGVNKRAFNLNAVKLGTNIFDKACVITVNPYDSESFETSGGVYEIYLSAAEKLDAGVFTNSGVGIAEAPKVVLVDKDAFKLKSGSAGPQITNVQPLVSLIVPSVIYADQIAGGKELTDVETNNLTLVVNENSEHSGSFAKISYTVIAKSSDGDAYLVDNVNAFIAIATIDGVKIKLKSDLIFEEDPDQYANDYPCIYGSVVLDMNGHNIAFKGENEFYIDGGRLHITGKGCIEGEYSLFEFWTGDEKLGLVIEKDVELKSSYNLMINMDCIVDVDIYSEKITAEGTFIEVSNTDKQIKDSDNASIVIHDGVKVVCASGINASSYANVNLGDVEIYATNGDAVKFTAGRLVIDGGVYTSGKEYGAAVNISSDSATDSLSAKIFDGTFSGAYSIKVHPILDTGKTANIGIFDGTFSGLVSFGCSNGSDSLMYIYGGDFVDDTGNNLFTLSANSDKFKISGGTFSDLSGASYCIDGTTYTLSRDVKNGNYVSITLPNSSDYGVVVINGGSFAGAWSINDENDSATNGTVSVYGGTFVGPINKDQTNSKLNIYGGTFSDLSGVNYCADGAVYKLGNDVDTGCAINVTNAKAFTIDFGGNTYTVGKFDVTDTWNSVFFLPASDLTFKNGAIAVSSENLITESHYMNSIFQGPYGSKLTIEDLQIDGTNLKDNISPLAVYLLEVSVSGETSIKAKNGVDAVGINEYGKVTIDTTGVIGDVTTGGALTIKNGTFGAIKKTGSPTVSITGGTFGSDVSSYLAADYVATKNGTTPESWTVSKRGAEDSEASIGTTYYKTLKNAFDAAKTGQTITVLKDIDLDREMVLCNGRVITLDLGTYSLTAKITQPFKLYGTTENSTNSGGKLVVKNGNLVGYDDADMNKTGLFFIMGNSSDESYKTVELVVESDVEITSGTNAIWIKGATSQNTNSFNVKVDFAGKVTGFQPINVNGLIKATSGNVPIIMIRSTAELYANKSLFMDLNYGIYLAGYARTTIEDGAKIVNSSNDQNPITIAAGELTINGGTFTAGSDIGELPPGPGGAISVEKCCAILIKQHNWNPPINVTINGGSFSGAFAVKQATGQAQSPDESKVTLSITGGDFVSTYTGKSTDVTTIYSADKKGFITGGTFDMNPYDDCEYTADDYAVIKNADGKYEVLGLAYVPANSKKVIDGKFTNTSSLIGKTALNYAAVNETVGNSSKVVLKEYASGLTNIIGGTFNKDLTTLTGKIMSNHGIIKDAYGYYVVVTLNDVEKDARSIVAGTFGSNPSTDNKTALDYAVIAGNVVKKADSLASEDKVIGGSFQSLNIAQIADNYAVVKDGSYYKVVPYSTTSLGIRSIYGGVFTSAKYDDDLIKRIALNYALVEKTANTSYKVVAYSSGAANSIYGGTFTNNPAYEAVVNHAVVMDKTWYKVCADDSVSGVVGGWFTADPTSKKAAGYSAVATTADEKAAHGNADYKVVKSSN